MPSKHSHIDVEIDDRELLSELANGLHTLADMGKTVTLENEYMGEIADALDRVLEAKPRKTTYRVPVVFG